MSRERCGNPVDISDKFDAFIDKHHIPYALLAETNVLKVLLTIKEAKQYIRFLEKYIKTFSEKEINRHNAHEYSCWQDQCPYAEEKAVERARKERAEELRRRANGESKPEIAKYYKAKPIAGYIYFIAGKDEGVGTFKIGKAKSLKQRKSWLEIKLPFPCEVTHIIKSDDYSTCEGYFHERFDDKRKNGEWFKLTNSDIDEVKKINVMNFVDTNSNTTSTTLQGVENE